MIRILLVAVFLGLAVPALAGDQTIIRPRFYDTNPRDGFLDPGSWSNPYEFKRSDGSSGTIRPRFYDTDPHDGVLDPGSWSNPWVMEED